MALTNKLSAIGNAIREKTGKTDLLTLDQMPEEIKGIETSGGVDYMSYMESIKFSNKVQEITEDVTLNLTSATSISGIIDQKSINFNKLTVLISNSCGSFQNSFRANGADTTTVFKEIEIIGDTSGVTTFINAFSGRRGLKKIIGVLTFCDGVTTASGMFNNCFALEEIRFAENCISVNISFSSSPNLTDETIQSIINGLTDLTGATTQTLTLHATVKARLTDTQIASITSKNWTLA